MSSGLHTLLLLVFAMPVYADPSFIDVGSKDAPEVVSLPVYPQMPGGKAAVLQSMCRVKLYDVLAGEVLDVNSFGQFTNDTADKMNVGISTALYACMPNAAVADDVTCIRADKYCPECNADTGSEGNIDTTTKTQVGAHHQKFRIVGQPAFVFSEHTAEVDIVTFGRAYNKRSECSGNRYKTKSGARYCNRLTVDYCAMQVRRWRP